MRIVEMYRSIQGESTFAGRPCTFVRTAGCSLRCAYCDTGYALSRNAGEEWGLDAIVRRVEELGIDLVEVTGGEPLEQQETPELCRRLLAKGATVLVETGGHCPVEALPPEAIKIMDLKTPGSGMVRQNRWENLEHLGSRDEIKFVLCGRDDFDWAVNACREHDLFGKWTIHFSPSFGQLSPEPLAQWILKESVPVRLQLQIHKYIWSPTACGV